MNVKIFERTEEYVEFAIEGTRTSFANALRRAMLSEVPVFAIEFVSIYENSSPLFDEYIAHRLAMIPLKTDYKGYLMPEECDDLKSSKCSTLLLLEAEGPCTVYSGDLKPTDPNIKPVHSNIPIIKLGEGQIIRMEARAVLGRGREHAKFQPGVAGFHPFPKLVVEGRERDMKKAVSACPRKALKLRGKKLEIDVRACNLCGNCEIETGGRVRVEEDKTKYLLWFESNGQLPAERVVIQAAKELERLAKEYLKEIRHIK